jgi:cysteine synthase
MTRLGLDTDVTDRATFERSIARFRESGARLPTFGELAAPETIPASIQSALADVDPDAPDPLNLFRVHWHNSSNRRGLAGVPVHSVLGEQLTGVPSPILVAHGDRFPMIRAHKVLAAYGCLVPRLVTGQFDPTAHRAIWPSTGNYCRGGVAISRTLGVRSAAVLPEGMSEERFRWLEEWVADPSDIIRTYGSESNVKEIYDKCAELDTNAENILFNQFCEFGNHLVHYFVTGEAMARVFEDVKSSRPGLRLAAFVSATGSAGTIAAGDALKDRYGSKTVAVEALECPTMLENGFGEHNIQGIGDKHIPFIHNVTNTDIAVAVSDRATDSLNVLLNTDVGREHLIRDRGLSEDLLAELEHFGLSSLCNVTAAIKTSKVLGLGADDAVVTVATDGARMYSTEIDKALAKYFPGGFDKDTAAAVYDEHLAGIDTQHLLQLAEQDRNRIFNLGYFTWVEQQCVSLEEFEVRRGQEFWRGLHPLYAAWDERIAAFNQAAGTA